MSAVPLPLVAFQHHVGPLYLDPARLDFVSELGVGEFALVEKGRLRPASDGSVQHTAGDDVVVKSYAPHVMATPEDVRELLLEANRLKRFHHP